MPTTLFPLVSNYTVRDSGDDTDQRFVNCYPEMLTKDEIYVVKRPGTTLNTQVVGTGAPEGRGVYSWEGNVYSVFDNKLYKGSTSLQTLNTSTGVVHWGQLKGTTDYLLLSDGTDLWTIQTDDTVTKVTDVDFPGAHVSGIVVMDGYVFVMKKNGEIYNCDLEDPLNWTASNFISAELESDDGVALVKHLNYVVALGDWSMQMFYDAANATGSPLSIQEGAVSHIGCAAGNSVVNINDTVVWVGQSNENGKFICMFEGLQTKIVSPKSINRLLEAEGSAISNSYAFVVSIAGHTFYILNLTSSNKTIVYDLADRVWCEFTSYNGTTESNFAYVQSTMHNKLPVLCHESDGSLYNFSHNSYTDNGNTIKVLGQTKKFNGTDPQEGGLSSVKNKFLDRLIVIGDKADNSALFYISFTDDDYQSFSNERTVDLNDAIPQLTVLGKFKRRAFKYRFEANLPMRVNSFELVYRIGNYGS